MKKILIVQETLVGGGAERVLVDILDKFDYSEYDVELLLLRNQGVYLNNINKNVKVKSIFGDFSIKKGINKKISWKLYNIILMFFHKIIINKYMDKKYDVIIGFLEGLSSLLVSEYNKSNAKKILWVHNDLKKLKTITFRVDKEIYNKVDKIICVSRDSRKSLIELYPEIEEKVEVIYNFINLDNIRNKSKETIEEIKINKRYLIGIGRLNKQKRFDVMIKAFKILIDQGFDIELIILGEGEEEKNIMELINKLLLQNHVKILGFKSNPYKYIKNAEIFVMSSDFEGLPVVMCESLVLGKPIVSTNCTGPSELLDNGKYGILTPCDNYILLSEKIKYLLENDEKLKYYSNMSLERSKIFDEDKAISEIYKLING